MITAVVVDNGEPLLERSLWSLRNQTVPVEIIVAAGPETNMELAGKYADKVMEQVAGIGKARVAAILEASTPYILSCDSDTIYDRGYAENALRGLRIWNAVKAAMILPLEGGPLAYVESIVHMPIPYEFALAFRKKAFLDAGIHLEDYSHPKSDIGRGVGLKMLPVPDAGMRCWTRLPTNYAKLAAGYAPIIALALAPIGFVAGIPIVNELLKRS